MLGFNTVGPQRTEAEIFDELSKLCLSPGYIHAIARLYIRGLLLTFHGSISASDVQAQKTGGELVRNEIYIILGLTLKQPIDLTVPEPSEIERYVQDTIRLLDELHTAILQSPYSHLTPENILLEAPTLFQKGEVLRESILYSSDSAYIYQYRDFAPFRYAADAEWLLSNMGFTIDQASEVVRASEVATTTRLNALLDPNTGVFPPDSDLLSCCKITAVELSQFCAVPEQTIDAILSKFAVQPNNRNDEFVSMQSTNLAEYTPLIGCEPGVYLLFNVYGFYEAIYESPFYWMIQDSAYKTTAESHRGEFTENFAALKLAQVFSSGHVYSNVRVTSSKGFERSEIDVLATYGDRAIVLQAKSKKLTRKARQGCDTSLRNDFSKSVQEAYNQGIASAKGILAGCNLAADNGETPLRIIPEIKQIYVMSVVAEHYPALNFQTHQFLETEEIPNIRPPYVLDVFALDAVAEFLPTPLLFIDFIERRVRYAKKLLAPNEFTVLSHHIKRPLKYDDDITSILLEEDIAWDLDVAMMARRSSPHAVDNLSRLRRDLPTSSFNNIVSQLVNRPTQQEINIGLALLALDLETSEGLAHNIDNLLRRMKSSERHRGITFQPGHCEYGLTLHFSRAPFFDAHERLIAHCKARKYVTQLDAWYGICLDPDTLSIRFLRDYSFKWVHSPADDAWAQQLPKPKVLRSVVKKNGRRS